MNYVGIAKALSYHSSAKEGDARQGNDTLLEEISPFSNLHPYWILKPFYIEEMDDSQAFVEKMLASKVRAGRMFPTPKENRRFLAQWSMGELLEQMEARRVPLFIDLSLFQEEEPDWAALDDLCGRHPHLPVVLAGVHNQDDWIFYPFMRSHRNFYLELSFHYVHRGIEDICEKFGAGRLIYGSGMPLVAPEEIMTMVTHARISQEDKQLIASGNLENLLKNVIAEDRSLPLKDTTANV